MSDPFLPPAPEAPFLATAQFCREPGGSRTLAEGFAGAELKVRNNSLPSDPSPVPGTELTIHPEA